MFSTSSPLVSSLLFAALAALGGAVLVEGRPTKTEEYHVPVFTVEELQQQTRNDELLEILGTTGLFSVVGSPRDQEYFQQTRQDGLLGLCECAKSGDTDSLFHSVEGVDSGVLSDGTKRTTLATATVGETPLSLSDEELIQAGCSAKTVDSMEKLRDHVAWVSHTFVAEFDRLLSPGETSGKALLRSDKGKTFASLQSIVKSSQNLEHFHVYEKSNQDQQDEQVLLTSQSTNVLDVHTDAGLFLAFVPGKQCQEGGTESSDLYVSLSNDVLHRAVFAPGSVGIMLGVGAENWLRTPSLALRATRHAVRMEPGQSRAWYGMMHTVPQDAIIQDFPQRTFADMRKSMVLGSKKAREFGDSESDEVFTNDVAIGCGGSSPLFSASDAGDARINRRRLGTVEDGTTCNNVTNFFCWMTCLDIPEAENAVSYINEGFSLYCLDPQVFAQSGNKVSAAYDECNGGFVHNPACMGSWQRTAPEVPAYSVLVDEDALLAVDESFCYGGTSMYMDGFHWTDSVCVIYLFPQWILNTAGALVGASFGTLFFGIALEGVIWKRRVITQAMSSGWMRLGASTVFYGLQLTMGYMLMLVVMTYSGPLFMCVVLGLMSGHFAFNAIAMKSKKDKSKEKNGEPSRCCEEEACLCTKDDEACETCGANGSSDDADSGSADSAPPVPEGITPCCQNTL